MKAIILSAGSGSRLGDLTKELPKSLVDINGKSVIQRQIETFRNNGIKELVVIVGPHKDKFQLNDVEYILDKNFAEHEQLSSLPSFMIGTVGLIVIGYGVVIFMSRMEKGEEVIE